MILTKIHVFTKKGVYPHQAPIHRKLECAPSDVLVLVPDIESFHEVKGMAFILNKVWEVQLLEPGEVISWHGMFSPWHLNTDKYRLIFDDFKPMFKER